MSPDGRASIAPGGGGRALGRGLGLLADGLVGVHEGLQALEGPTAVAQVAQAADGIVTREEDLVEFGCWNDVFNVEKNIKNYGISGKMTGCLGKRTFLKPEVEEKRKSFGAEKKRDLDMYTPEKKEAGRRWFNSAHIFTWRQETR